MLGQMRDRDGRPNGAMKVLGLLLALVLAGPLVVLLARGARTLLERAL